LMRAPLPVDLHAAPGEPPARPEFPRRGEEVSRAAR
jgi:hypothetical protein